MTAVDRYNALDGQTVKREELQKIAVLGAKQGQTKISLKLFKLLEENDNEEFKIKLSQYELDKLNNEDLPGLEYAAPDEEFEGLQKAVSPDEIYQYITDLMINTIKEVGDLPWQREWDKTALFNGYQATNFESKKGYRGINFMLLNFEVKVINGVHTLVPKNWENPYFLTFNQIEKNKGQLTKGSKGKRVIYFTQLYTHSERNKKNEVIFDYSTYNKKKFAAWAKKNQNRIHVIKSGLRSLENFIESSYLPILKYYNVFNGEDITGIDWGTLPKNENVDKPEKQRIEIAEKIIELYPNKPQIIYKGDQPAYYPLQDQILMTPIEAFETEQSYYTTLFHECIHSTGHSIRLKRGLGASKKGDASYAFEELIAELGAVFLSAESGILFQVRDNSAKYLKGWNSRLVKAMKDDNRFFFRASSKAQAGSDYILDRDKNGVPAYQNSINRRSSKIISPEKKNGNKNSKKPTTNDLLEKQKSAKLTAKNKIEFEKGLKKLGFEIFSYDSKQASPKEWERTYKLNFKDITGLTLKMGVKPDKKVIEGEYSWEAFGIDTESYIDYDKLQEFYEEILAEFKEVLGKMTLAEAAGLKKEFSKTLFGKKEPKTQLGLFGAVPKKLNRKDTLKFAENNLIGKGFYVDALGEEVYFSMAKIKHAINPPSRENLALVYKLPELLSKSVLLSQQADKKKRKEIKTVFKLVLIENLFGKTVRVLITIRKQDKNYYYDHAVIDTIKPEKQHGSINKVNPIPLDVASPVLSKDKKKSNSKKKGLKSPGEIAVATVPVPETNRPAPEQNIINSNSLAARMQRNANREKKFYQINNPDIAKFLGNVEIKDKESVGISITAPQGAGKTRFAFQLIDAFATNYKVGHASMEEHPDSSLYESKAIEYLDPKNLDRIDTPDINNMNDIRKLVEDNDIIVIDSFEKLREIDKNIQVDQDFRKKYDGKLFIFIFQLTSDGKMRGGSKSQFDVDIVLETEKFEDYRENYIYPNKNRYNSIPPSDLKFNIFKRAMIPVENATDVSDIHSNDITEDPISSSSQIPESGRLIATPVI